MKMPILIVFLLSSILVTCSRSKSVHTPQIQVTSTPIRNTLPAAVTHQETRANLRFSPTPTMVILSATITSSPSPSPILTRSLTPNPIPYPPPGYLATPAPTELPTPTPTLELPGALDRKDPSSLVQWLRYGLEMQDLSYIRPLLAETIRYSRAFSDLPGENLSKATFLSEFERRLANHPFCISYNIQLGGINELFIATGVWNPPWEFDGAEWDNLILDFSDYWTKEEGLYLFGAYVDRGWWTNPPDWVSCR